MRKKKGSLLLVLHAHLPFIRHPEHERFLEEDWFFEAITETYIPLLWAYEQLLDEGVRFKITMSLTPPLLSMFEDGLLRDRYQAHLERLCELSEKEVRRTREDPILSQSAAMYRRIFTRAHADYTGRWKRDLAGAFRRIQEAGALEIVTCGATHGFFPLIGGVPETVWAQAAVAVRAHRRILGRAPRGIWLPECAYWPGHEKILSRLGIQFTFLDAHGLLFARPRPEYGVFRPLRTPSGLAVFGRDVSSSKQVWSADEGYPGDGVYREFYRDLGFDAEYDYIKPYIHPIGFRTNTGIKYHRITSKRNTLTRKALYHPEWAEKMAESHAGHFMWCRERQVEHLEGVLKDAKPVVVAPFDAELFGHWWFEGPLFLEHLLRKTARDSEILDLATPATVLEDGDPVPSGRPAFSTWGDQGYAKVWLNGSNDWVYPHLFEAAERMVRRAREGPDGAARGEISVSLARRILDQMGRELLLAQSSDWAFLMSTGTAIAYATKRTKDHVHRFLLLDEMLREGRCDIGVLEEIERRDNLFPDLDSTVFAGPEEAERFAFGEGV